MRSLRLFAVIALLSLLHAEGAIAETLCKPNITVGNANFSQAINMRRYWTATINVDASACAGSSGLFALGFVRLSETAPDIELAEPLIWRPGQMTARVEFWWDEAIGRYWIADVAACPCNRK